MDWEGVGKGLGALSDDHERGIDLTLVDKCKVTRKKGLHYQLFRSITPRVPLNLGSLFLGFETSLALLGYDNICNWRFVGI